MAVWIAFMSAKGHCRVSISQQTIANENTSAFSVYREFARISGAIHAAKTEAEKSVVDVGRYSVHGGLASWQTEQVSTHEKYNVRGGAAHLDGAWYLHTHEYANSVLVVWGWMMVITHARNTTSTHPACQPWTSWSRR